MTTQPVGSDAHTWVSDVLSAAVIPSDNPDVAAAMACRLGCECEPHNRPGRPSLPPERRRDAVIRVRVTAAEMARFERLGGAEWLRSMLHRP